MSWAHFGGSEGALTDGTGHAPPAAGHDQLATIARRFDRLQTALQLPLPSQYPATERQENGGMFWFMWKKFSGSYLALSSWRRW